MSPMPDRRPEEIQLFWQLARVKAKLNRLGVYTGATPLDSLPPPAWAFGGTYDQADQLLELVLQGTKTATAAALWDYEAGAEPVPTVGDLAIVLDGGGHPRALIGVTDVRVLPFQDVDADHAFAEGEGDRSLAHWREVHRRFFTTFAEHDRGFAPDMPVVLERFRLLYPTPRNR